jgi:hypothetical protein
MLIGLLAIGALHTALLLASAEAVFAQGSTGGTLGKTDQSLSGDRLRIPAKADSGSD